MEEKKIKQEPPECLPKLPTGIRGLDKVLYGGIDVNLLNNDKQLVIVIRGNEDDNDKSMLAMQMLYGITQAIEEIKGAYNSYRLEQYSYHVFHLLFER